ncbi:hypothetical protein HanIR_Chr16g0834211 [Helianthus annuus]|nr:hypothetical protein HanIR_Chr16g0834211 [Helianthus annuus]
MNLKQLPVTLHTTDTNNFVVQTICLMKCKTHKTDSFTNILTSWDRWDDCKLLGGGIKHVIFTRAFAPTVATTKQ